MNLERGKSRETKTTLLLLDFKWKMIASFEVNQNGR
jgi:hypothetical protein